MCFFGADHCAIGSMPLSVEVHWLKLNQFLDLNRTRVSPMSFNSLDL